MQTIARRASLIAAVSGAAVTVGCWVGVLAPAVALPLIETESQHGFASGEIHEAVGAGALELRKTLAGKVLAAIALERVTGRKPDPIRFSELN